MRITPLDVRKQEFRKSVRGFDCDEVRAFLETLSHEYETVLVDNKHLREEFMAQDDKISEYKTMEKTLRDTLMTAERLMQDTRKNASTEGKLIIQDAEMKARNIMEECRLRTVELRREIMSLRQEKENYLARFEGLAQAQIQFIANHKSDFEDVDNRLLELAHSVVPKAPVSGVSIQASTDSIVAAITDDDSDQWRNYETNTGAETSVDVETNTTKVTSASVGMAAMGIPVPAVPRDEIGSDALFSVWPPVEATKDQNEAVLT